MSNGRDQDGNESCNNSFLHEKSWYDMMVEEEEIEKIKLNVSQKQTPVKLTSVDARQRPAPSATFLRKPNTLQKPVSSTGGENELVTSPPKRQKLESGLGEVVSGVDGFHMITPIKCELNQSNAQPSPIPLDINSGCSSSSPKLLTQNEINEGTKDLNMSRKRRQRESSTSSHGSTENRVAGNRKKHRQTQNMTTHFTRSKQERDSRQGSYVSTNRENTEMERPKPDNNGQLSKGPVLKTEISGDDLPRRIKSEHGNECDGISNCLKSDSETKQEVLSQKIKKEKDLPQRPKPEMETDSEVLARRQKQIDYGKNTVGYDNYARLVPKSARKKIHPRTPPKHLKYSRRAWDGIVKVWRQELHLWDSATGNVPLDSGKDSCSDLTSDMDMSDRHSSAKQHSDSEDPSLDDSLLYSDDYSDL